jgi:3-deoxy-7-phosphoheptulonate synthase
MLDVMHGNTININNIKTRNMSDMINELQFFNFIIKDSHLKWGGIHLENTYEDVTECVDSEITINKLQLNYKTYCDPRMNQRQTLFFIKNLVQLI